MSRVEEFDSMAGDLVDAAAGMATCFCDHPRCGCGASVELLNAAAIEVHRLQAEVAAMKACAKDNG